MRAGTATIATNLERVRERIARAAERAGRHAEEITIVAVSKTFPASAIREAYGCGLRHFGENRVQEWATKRPQVSDLDATWHLVGHLQSNKAQRAARLFHAVDSLDDVSLAKKLSDAVAQGGASRMPVLLEVRLSHEETKTGVSEAELTRLAETVLGLPHLDLRGLMTIPPYFENPEGARPIFRKLKQIRDELSSQLTRELPELSMGMSHDFEVAIEEGATQIRLGTALFGERPKV